MGILKLNKEDINFPCYCLCFIKKIQNAINELYLDEKDFEEKEAEIEIIYPYCQDGFDLIRKTFWNKGYTVSIPTYRTKNKNNTLYYVYKCKIKKCLTAFCDDLPF